MSIDLFRAVVAALERDERVVLVTIVRAQGSTPQRVGARMAVFADGSTAGTIGGGCYENDAFWKAREALDTGRSQVMRYDLTDDFAEESGLICGGQMEVHIDRDTGKLAQPGCPRVYEEAFLTGTEPLEICELHRW